MKLANFTEGGSAGLRIHSEIDGIGAIQARIAPE